MDIFLRAAIVILIINCPLKAIFCQNLLPNGSFEQVRPFSEEYPFAAFYFLENWEVSSFLSHDSTLVRTPDLFGPKVLVPNSYPPTFWNLASGAAEGKYYVGLVNTPMMTGYFQPEAISTSLKTILEKDSFYTIRLSNRNKGIDWEKPTNMVCVEESLKKLQFYFGEKPVKISINESDYSSVASGIPTLSIHTPNMLSNNLNGWVQIGTCFQAKGNEAYLTLSMTVGEVSVRPPCVIYDQHFDSFYSYYFDIDDIQLEKMPTNYQLLGTLCKGRNTVFNIKDSINIPVMIDPIEIWFDNKRIDSTVVFNRGGDYQLSLKTDCNTIPILLQLEEINCTPSFYIPNVFSPNLDGINDQWEIFLQTEVEVVAYKLLVFDRWGNKVFEAKNIRETWDGTYQGKLLNNGAFFYTIQYEYIDPEFGISFGSEQGSVVLVR